MAESQTDSAILNEMVPGKDGAPDSSLPIEDGMIQISHPQPDSLMTVADSLREALHEKEEVITVPEALPPAWMEGMEPLPRPEFNGRDQGYVTTVVILMLGMCLTFRTIQRIWRTLIKRLWSSHAREDYDENLTGKEKRVIGLLLVVTVFFISLIWNAAMSKLTLFYEFSFPATLTLCALVGGYFAFQYIVYWIIGTAFVNDEGRQLWVEGFTASMALLGITLIIPGLFVLFYPDLLTVAIYISAAFYVIARIMFICKGFRIFYTNLGSLVYFILYLCSLEIVPLTILYFLAEVARGI